MNVPSIIFGKPHIDSEDIEAVITTLKSGWIGTGTVVQQFQNSVKEYKSTSHSIALTSCSAALFLSLSSFNLSRDDEVIVPVMTFCSTAHSVISAGGTPVFVDCDYPSFLVTADLIERAITSRTKVIIVVHVAGFPCDMDAIMDVAKRHDLFVIEDCAHALEAKYKGVPVGTIGNAGCFSFYATKSIGIGEGGMVITDSSDMAAYVKRKAYLGISPMPWERTESSDHYKVEDIGFKFNLTDLAASLGVSIMRKIDDRLSMRQSVFCRYNDAFKELPFILPSDRVAGGRHAYHLYSLLIDESVSGFSRDEFRKALKEAGIGTGIHFESLHLQPYYKNTYGLRDSEFPNSGLISRQTLSLPLSSNITEKEVRHVIDTVKHLVTLLQTNG
jgi:dTDP-4-amino-4,6-dideoxygalactose transaminase